MSSVQGSPMAGVEAGRSDEGGVGEAITTRNWNRVPVEDRSGWTGRFMRP